MPSTTGPALGVVLRSHHEQMPSLRLDRDEMEPVIDSILAYSDEAGRGFRFEAGRHSEAKPATGPI